MLHFAREHMRSKLSLVSARQPDGFPMPGLKHTCSESGQIPVGLSNVRPYSSTGMSELELVSNRQPCAFEVILQASPCQWVNNTCPVTKQLVCWMPIDPNHTVEFGSNILLYVESTFSPPAFSPVLQSTLYIPSLRHLHEVASQTVRGFKARRIVE